MKVAIMQPYFFPYIGYWQLLNAVNEFVLFDDAQYIRHGWVNRNRILKPSGGWQYIVVPVKKHDLATPIKDVLPDSDKDWKGLIFRQLAHYRKKAKFYGETMRLVEDALMNNSGESIAQINCLAIERLCRELNIETTIKLSSRQGYSYEDVSDPGEWALRMSEQMGADEYINPIGGSELFDKRKFKSSNIKLSFIESGEIVYSQGDGFQSSLSIIDVLMFNGIEGARKLLTRCRIESL